jgi:SAM-dependent methyltransferase
MQDKTLRVFELGLGTNNLSMPSNMGANGKPGASLYGWREFFPNSNIYGADIDMNILFESERIKTYYCDQTNPVLIKMLWNQTELVDGFDIIVEDGLHEYHANVCFFENSAHKLNVGGYFIIEDILHYELRRFESKIGEWISKFPDLEFTLLRIPSQRNKHDNNLLVIKKTK